MNKLILIIILFIVTFLTYKLNSEEIKNNALTNIEIIIGNNKEIKRYPIHTFCTILEEREYFYVIKIGGSIISINKEDIQKIK